MPDSAADTYVSEGDYLWRIGKFSDAIQAYELGLKTSIRFPEWRSR